MVRRVVAVVAVGVAALLVLGTGARAQTYPPPTVSITVDPAKPVAGQDVTIVLTGCKPHTIALIGIDLVLVDTPLVGSDGVATTTVELPAWLKPGRHLVTGVCLGAGGDPVVVSTSITVRPASDGTSTSTQEATGTDSDGAAITGGGTTGGGSDGSTGGPAAGGAPSLDGLDATEAPADADEIYEAAAIAGTVDAAEPGTTDVPAGAGEATTPAGDSGPGAMGIIARVAFGLAALGGVPVAMALSRGRGVPIFSGRFAAQR